MTICNKGTLQNCQRYYICHPKKHVCKKIHTQNVSHVFDYYLPPNTWLSNHGRNLPFTVDPSEWLTIEKKPNSTEKQNTHKQLVVIDFRTKNVSSPPVPSSVPVPAPAPVPVPEPIPLQKSMSKLKDISILQSAGISALEIRLISDALAYLFQHREEDNADNLHITYSESWLLDEYGADAISVMS